MRAYVCKHKYTTDRCRPHVVFACKAHNLCSIMELPVIVRVCVRFISLRVYKSPKCMLCARLRSRFHSLCVWNNVSRIWCGIYSCCPRGAPVAVITIVRCTTLGSGAMRGPRCSHALFIAVVRARKTRSPAAAVMYTTAMGLRTVFL